LNSFVKQGMKPFVSNIGADMSGRTSDPPPVTSAIGVENPCPRRKSNRYVLSLTIL